MVDLPAPIMPTSTTERIPSAAVISASGEAGLTGEAVSGIDYAQFTALCGVRATYTTPADTVARDFLQRQGEHVGSRATIPDDLNG